MTSEVISELLHRWQLHKFQVEQIQVEVPNIEFLMCSIELTIANFDNLLF